MVDAMCNGRLVVGLGTGNQPYEFDRFRISLDEKNEMLTGCLDIIELGLTQPAFSYDGTHYRIPEMQIAVRSVQRPIPEIWVAGMMPEALKSRFAESGYVPFFTPAVRPITHLEQVRDNHRAVARGAGVAPDQHATGLMRYMHVTSESKEAEGMLKRALYSSSVSFSLRAPDFKPDGAILSGPPIPGGPSAEEVMANIIVGDPETCAERLARDIEVMNPAHIAFYVQPGGLPHACVMRSLERFGTEVIPSLEKAVGPLDRIGGRRGPPTPRMGKAAYGALIPGEGADGGRGDDAAAAAIGFVFGFDRAEPIEVLDHHPRQLQKPARRGRGGLYAKQMLGAEPEERTLPSLGDHCLTVPVGAIEEDRESKRRYLLTTEHGQRLWHQPV